MLPFANLARDSADLYLAEGLTEELISRLGAVARLRVPGRSVVQRAQAVVADPQALARRLGVRYLVEGSVRRGLFELGHVYLLLHRWRDALRLCDSAVAENPELARAYVGRARARTFLGDAARAAEDARRAIGLATGIVLPEARAALIAALATSGDTAGARAALAELEAALAGDSTSLSPTTIATGLVALGQRERAIAVLRPIAASGLLSWLLRYPEFDPIRTDPAFRRIEAAARARP